MKKLTSILLSSVMAFGGSLSIVLPQTIGVFAEDESPEEGGGTSDADNPDGGAGDAGDADDDSPETQPSETEDGSEANPVTSASSLMNVLSEKTSSEQEVLTIYCKGTIDFSSDLTEENKTNTNAKIVSSVLELLNGNITLDGQNASTIVGGILIDGSNTTIKGFTFTAPVSMGTESDIQFDVDGHAICIGVNSGALTGISITGNTFAPAALTGDDTSDDGDSPDEDTSGTEIISQYLGIVVAGSKTSPITITGNAFSGSLLNCGIFINPDTSADIKENTFSASPTETAYFVEKAGSGELKINNNVVSSANSAIIIMPDWGSNEIVANVNATTNSFPSGFQFDLYTATADPEESSDITFGASAKLDISSNYWGGPSHPAISDIIKGISSPGSTTGITYTNYYTQAFDGTQPQGTTTPWTSSGTTTPPGTGTPSTPNQPSTPDDEEPEPEEPTPPTVTPPVDNPVTDDENNSADFEPNSGTNAGVKGDGEGFTTEGSQTLTDSNGNSVTFTQNSDGSKAASTQNSDGEVTSSVVTVPASSITDGQSSVSLGTNASGQSLGIVGNKATESSAPSLTINLPVADTETKVTLPVVEGTLDPGTVAMLVGENGELTPIITTVISDQNSTITIPLQGSAKVVVLDNSLSFSDSSGVPAYATQAAAYTSARRLMTGMGESSPKPFDYNGQTSRGQFATILYRLEGQPSVSGAYPDGIEPGAWNANPARWAVENGYMGKGGSAFNPQADITRDQIIAIVYRMNGAPAVDQSVLDKYSDAGLIPEGDFRDAMAWGVSKGIIGQGVTTLDPEDDASRAEIAAMIQRIIENLY